MRSAALERCRVMHTAAPASLALVLASAASAQQYELVPLPDLGGAVDGLAGGVLRVTDSGRAVGACHDADGNLRAVAWDRVGDAWTIEVLPSLGDGSRDMAYASNAIGRIFGASIHADGTSFHAVQWVMADGAWTATDLGTLGGTQSTVFGMSAGTLLAGGAQDASGLHHAVLWRNGAIEDIASIPGLDIVAHDVNNLGQVAGGGYWRPAAFLWLPEPAYGFEAGYHALPTLGGDSYDAALAINDRGLLCGYCFDLEGVGHPVVWRQGELIDLTPGNDQQGWAEAMALNERDQVVGYYRTETGAEHAFLWEHDELTDLNDLVPGDGGWKAVIASTISEAGWIGGYGKLDDGPYAPILLLPSCSAVTGDVNGDGVVDVSDLLIVLANWG